VKDENVCRGAAVKFRFVSFLPLFVFMLSGGAILAQDESAPVPGNSGMDMVAQTTRAVNYRRGDNTSVDIKGTDLMPEVSGKAKVISKRGLIDVHVDAEHLRPAKDIDLAYLTYVLWAISPQGNPKNLENSWLRMGRRRCIQQPTFRPSLWLSLRNPILQ
jgi:hypothetical protein